LLERYIFISNAYIFGVSYYSQEFGEMSTTGITILLFVRVLSLK